MILTILKYLGLCIAATSSIWGTTHELTVKTADNRKRLTKAGIVSILFVILGLVLSIISDDIGRRHTAQEQYAKVAAEARRTNEITIASQPLASLNFVLQFENSDTIFRRRMIDGDRDIRENEENEQGGVPEVPYQTMEYESSLIPMLKFLAQLGDNKPKQSEVSEGDVKTDVVDSNGIIALIPLDGSPNAILSFGEIYGRESWNDDDSTHRLSAGFSPVNNEARSGITSPYTTKTFSADGPSKYTIEWNLDPITLENSVDRANSGIRSGAKLPQVLNLLILRISETSPFSYNNFALTTASNLWEHANSEKGETEVNKVFNMTLSVQVNGFSELEYHYKLVSIYPKVLYDNWGEELNIGCTVLEFRLN